MDQGEPGAVGEFFRTAVRRAREIVHWLIQAFVWLKNHLPAAAETASTRSARSSRRSTASTRSCGRSRNCSAATLPVPRGSGLRPAARQPAEGRQGQLHQAVPARTARVPVGRRRPRAWAAGTSCPRCSNRASSSSGAQLPSRSDSRAAIAERRRRRDAADAHACRRRRPPPLPRTEAGRWWQPRPALHLGAHPPPHPTQGVTRACRNRRRRPRPRGAPYVDAAAGDRLGRDPDLRPQQPRHADRATDLRGLRRQGQVDHRPALAAGPDR
jgi:hypothetical protein